LRMVAQSGSAGNINGIVAQLEPVQSAASAALLQGGGQCRRAVSCQCARPDGELGE
jgi:hypothetical protein